MKRTVIAGGTGLIGRALAIELVGAGHQVVVLSRGPHSGRRGLPSGVSAEQWDGATTDGWAHVVDGAEAVVNFAGESIADGRWTPQRKRRIRDSRVDAAAAIVKAVTSATVKPKVVVHGSAVGYYGPRGTEEIGEYAEPGDDFLAEVTRAAEDAMAPIASQGVRLVIARTGVVFSLAGGALPKMLMPFKFGVGGAVGSGRQYLPWIHIADEVGALRFLIDSETAEGAFNLTAPAPATYGTFAKAAGRAMGRPSVMPVPGFIMKLAFGEMSTTLLNGQRAVPRRLVESGYAFRFGSVDEALQDLL